MNDLSALSDDELLKLLQQHQAPKTGVAAMSDEELMKALGSTTFSEKALDVAKSAGTGLAKGVIGLAGLPGDVANLAAHGGEWIGNKLGLAPLPEDVRRTNESSRPVSSKDIQGQIEKVTGQFYQPKTTMGRYTDTAASFIPGSMAGGAGVVRNAIRYGVIPGAASEAAGQATEGLAIEPWARAGTALLTGGATAALSRPRNAEAALAPAMQNIDQATLTAAQGLMAEAANRGINLSWPQAIAQINESAGRPLQQMQRFVERTREGGPSFSQFYEGQPQAIRGSITNELGNVAPPSANPYMVGQNAAEAARGAIDDVRNAINQGTEHLYRGSAHHLVANANTGSPAFQSVRNQILNDDILSQSVPGVGAPLQNFPPHSVASINMTQQRGREIAENLRTHQGGNNRYKASLIDRQIDDAVQAARAQSPDFDQAMRLQAQFRADTLTPLEQGPLGRVANAGTTEQATEAMFGPKLAGGEGQVRRAIVNMENRQPGIGSALTRQYLEDKANAASANLVGGQNYYGGAKFAKDVFGNPQSAADVRAAISGAPGGVAANAGMDQLVEALRATGKRLPEGSQTATDLGLADTIGNIKGPIERTASIAGQPLGAAGRAVDEFYGRWRVNRTAADLARILQNPDEIELLARLSRQGRRGNTAAALLANALREGLRDRSPNTLH